jgi:hypothetical protein
MTGKYSTRACMATTDETMNVQYEASVHRWALLPIGLPTLILLLHVRQHPRAGTVCDAMAGTPGQCDGEALFSSAQR